MTEAEKAAGQATITGLTPETAYRINMYNGDKERGEKTFTTIADLAGAILVREGDDLGALLEAANEGDVFALYGGNHAIGGDTAAAECAVISKSITIKGIYPTKRPRILGRFQLNDGASLTMSQVVVDGANNTSGDQAFNYKTDGVTYGALDVQDCEIKNFTKGLLYLNVAATINTVTFNNCLIHDIVCDGGDFYDCRESNGFDGTVKLLFSGLELTENRGSDHRHYRTSVPDIVQDIEDLRYFENGSEGACVQALAAVDTLVLVNMLHTVLILGDGLYGAGLLAGYGDVHDSMVGTALIALSAVDAEIMVYDCLTVTLDVVGDSTLGAVHRATACHAAAAEIGNLVIGLYAG